MIKLNGVSIPDYVKVNKVEFSILPKVTNNTLDVRGKRGLYFINQEVEERTITVSLSIIADKANGVAAKARELAAWLYHEKPVNLEIADEPDKYYSVILDGDTKVTEESLVGQVDITFLCVEPFAFGASKTYKFTNINSDPFGVVVGGTAETSPVIDLEIKNDITDIAVVTGDKQVMIGTPPSVDDTVSNTNKRILWDEMHSLSEWTSAIGIDGEVQGSIRTTGYSFVIDAWGEGPNSGWYGPALVKTLSEKATDFEVQMMFKFNTTHVNQVGRVELYLFDSNNNNIGKVHFSDGTTGKHSQNFMARAGNAGTGKMFIEERNYSIWNNMNHGLLRIVRTGNTWAAYVGKWSSKLNRYDCGLYREWVDTKGTTLAQLAKIQVHLGAWGKHYGPNAIAIEDIKVFNKTVNKTEAVPIIAEAGDVLTVDCEKAIVLKNGLPFYEQLKADSKFFSLKPGTNLIAVSPPEADVNVNYVERWL